MGIRAQQWLPIPQEAKPYTRWWWLGSAVDSVGLDYNLSELAKAGIGGVEITPIYGVQGNDANDISYLSPRWMRMLKYVEIRGTELGIETNMATGTGWPFGGPLVTEEDAAHKIVFDADQDATLGRTGQKVKRAAPGGEGFVIDHFDHDAVAHYFERFDTAFAHQNVPFPRVMFNDSYEVYGADWTPMLFDEFQKRRGYDLMPFTYILNKKDSLRTDADKRIVSDYRETLGELLLENFTTQWTDWAHRHGSLTRNQAHGSPANLLDVYAAVDIPECEGFGLSDFGIIGLRTDKGFTKKNDSDISMLKYASSAAHISGKKYTSSETFTWLTEHFRTSLSQCKPDLDLMFLSGVNHIFFHGSCYSPKGAEWPGWRFYASVDMSPNNNWWAAMPAFSQYIQRCQSFLQWGEPDNDVLVYLPYYDMLYDQSGTVALFDIHSMEKRAPKFIETVQTIIKSGYDVDYISDRYLMRDDITKRYATIIIPDVRFMPTSTLKRLMQIAEQGGQVMFVRSFPTSVPGYGKTAEQQEFATLMGQLQHTVTFHPEQAMRIVWGKGSIVTSPTYSDGLQFSSARREPMRLQQGLSCIRRSNSEGYHYFISNLQGKDVDTFITLGVKAKKAVFYNPMDGKIDLAKMDAQGRVRVQLKSGESIILRTFTEGTSDTFKSHVYYKEQANRAKNLTNWTLSFKESAPVQITKKYTMEGTPQAWTTLGDSLLNTTMATGVYKTSFTLPKMQPNTAYLLDLGDVRETAHVLVNGKEVGTLFAVPFRVDVTPYLHEGANTLEVEVANLPANRIAQMDRDGVQWRKFKEINVVDLNYKRDLYSHWTTVPSGLNSEVKLIPCTIE
ncbi:MAG: glycosyl hydrolase family 2 [Bacteroidaceae bacterium]|nr:glycosyl hydrolase family 2 [Bacteroidaceae bacterium]